MKVLILATWGLILTVTGCTVPGIPGAPYRMADKSKRSAHVAKRTAPSWTDRVTAMIPGGKDPAPTPPRPTTTPAQRNDPISLGFASGPPTSKLFLSLAQMSDRTGKSEHARSMYRQALSIEPNNLDALLGLARLEDREGQLGEALKIYQQAAASHPQNANALNDLGLCYARSGQFTDSIRDLDQAVRLQPEKALYRNNIAKVLTQVDRVDEAVAHLSAVHSPAIAQYNMGALLKQRGKTVEAVHFLTAASHIDPQLQPAHAMLAELRGSVPATITNDGILPTPVTPTTYRQNLAVGSRYSSSAAQTASVQPQAFPAETAQVPQVNSPVTLPPVR